MKKAREWLNKIARRERVRWGLWLSLALIFSLTAAPRLALAQEWLGQVVDKAKELIPLGPGGSIITLGLNVFALLVGAIARLLIAIIGYLLTEGEKIFALPEIGKAWGAALALTNSLFLLGLIVAALGLILRAGAYNFKRVISGILLGAIFANLSLTLARLFISLARALAFGASSLFEAPGKNNIESLQAGLYRLLQSPAESFWSVLKGLVLFFYGPSGDLIRAFLNLVVAIVVLVAVAKIGIVLIERTVRLVILVILAPIVYPLALFPTTERYLKEWWENFIRWLLVLPLAYLILSFVGVLMTSPSGSVGATGLAEQIARVRADPGGGTIPALVYSLVILALIWGAGEVASWLGAKAVIGGLLKKGAGYAAGFAAFAGGALVNLGGLVGGRGETLAGRAKLAEQAVAEGAGETMKARAVKLGKRAEVWKGVGRGLKAFGAFPSAVKGLYAGAGKRTEKFRAEGRQEIFRAAEKIPGVRDIARQAEKEEWDKIASSIAETPINLDDLKKGLKEAEEKGDSRMLYILSKAAGLRIGRSQIPEERKEIQDAINEVRGWLDDRIFIAAEKQGREEALNSEDKQALAIERLIGSERTGYVGNIQRDMNFGRPFPVDIKRAGQREGEGRPSDIYEAKTTDSDLDKKLEEASSDLPGPFRNAIRNSNLEETQKISSLITILIKQEKSRETLVQSLKGIGFDEDQAQEAAKDPRTLAGLADEVSLETSVEFNQTKLGKLFVEKKVSKEEQQKIIQIGQEYNRTSADFSEQSKELSDTGQEVVKTLTALKPTELTKIQNDWKGAINTRTMQEEFQRANPDLKREINERRETLIEPAKHIYRAVGKGVLNRTIREVEETPDPERPVSEDDLSRIAQDLDLVPLYFQDAKKNYRALRGKLLLLREAIEQFEASAGPGKAPSP